MMKAREDCDAIPLARAEGLSHDHARDAFWPYVDPVAAHTRRNQDEPSFILPRRPRIRTRSPRWGLPCGTADRSDTNRAEGSSRQR